MKKTLVATAIALAATAAANATTPAIWQGDLFITTASTSAATLCNSVGISTGDVVQAIFAPKNASTSSDELAVFFPGGSAHQLVPQGKATALANATNVIITHIQHNAGLKTENVTLPAAIKISSPTSGTQSLTVSVANLGTTGCNVTFNGILVPRPGNLPN